MRSIQYAVAYRFHHPRPWNTGSPAGACHRAALCADPVAGDDGLCRHCEPTGRANARPMTGSAKQSILRRKERKSGLLRCARNDVVRVPHTTSIPLRSRGAMRPSCARILRAQRGRGECRMPAAPAASCALGIGRKHTSNNEHTGITRHSRTQWFYGLFRALPGDRALLPPSLAEQGFVQAR
jgi:hypothetical protein